MRYFFILFFAVPTIACQNEIIQKENELARMESDIQYQKYYARSNLLREGAACTIATAGIIASVVTPKHLVYKKENRPITTFLRKVGVGTVILGYTAIGATMVKVTRPILWVKEYRRDRLKEKIFDLKAMQ